MSSLKDRIAELRAKTQDEEQEVEEEEEQEDLQGLRKTKTKTKKKARRKEPQQREVHFGPRDIPLPDPTYYVDREPISLPREECDDLQKRIMDNLYEILDPSALGELPRKQVEGQVRKQADSLLQEEDISLNRREREQFVKDIVDDMLGYGPLEPLLEDPSVSDILVNGAKVIYVERGGLLELTDARFRNDDHLMQVMDRIVREVNRRIDEGSPMCDARMPDGSRVNAIIPPLAIDYPSMSIRKFRTDVLGVKELVNDFQTLTDEIALVLEAVVKARMNCLISGGGGAGKTTLLNIMSSFIPPDERIVTIEDSAELQLQQPHVVRLETRPPNIEGEGEVGPYDLVKNALRMRPERIILGEVRGAEALDMLQAMNTGHEGSMCTIHANTPRDALSRIETMISMGGVELPQKAMRKQIASAIDIVIQIDRMADGSRKLTAFSEVLGLEGDTVTMQDIFNYKKEGLTENNKVQGRHISTGVQPRFQMRLKASGIEVPGAIFLSEETAEHKPDMLAKARSSLEGDEKQKNPVTYHIDRRSVAMKAERYNEVKNDLQQRLYDEMDPTALTELEEDRMESHISSAAKKLLKETALNLNRNERQQLLKDITDEMMGFGPLEPLLEDPEVSDILVNGAKQTYVEVSGKLHLTDVEFNDNEHVMHVIDRIVTTVGRHVDEGSPMCDARLPDGSRVNVIIPPLAIDYPSVSIRKFKTDALSVSDLVDKFNSMSREMATLLEACVSAGLNILISGGTGAGKTTLLNILSGFIPQHERIVTIEDSAELQLQKPHVVRLETRPPNIEGKGEITPYDLLRNALRMRADRIILGEVRGEEALDMLQAMNTGHEGSMSTIHANTPRDAISRLENLVAMGGLDLPQKAMRKQIASAIDLIVQGNRFSDGTRKQTCISEVLGMEGDQVTMQDIFLFDREGIGENGKVLGEFVATGVQPRFLQKLKSSGVNLPLDLFSRE